MKTMQITSKAALLLFVSIVGFLSCSTGTTVSVREANVVVWDSSLSILKNKTGSFNYGRIYLNQSVSEVFSIKNKGKTDLELTGSPIVEISGAGSNVFVVTEQASSPVTPDTTASFKIEFTPTVRGKISATVSIANSSNDDNPYTFIVSGTGRGMEGDFNGDGIQDVIVGAQKNDAGGNEAGCAYIFFGSSNWNSNIDASSADVILIGENPDDYFGFSVSSAGDVNCDGYDDVLVGAYYGEDGGVTSGCAYIFFGRQNWNSSINASNADVKLIGEVASDQFGWSVSSAGDVNNDDCDDVIIGAPFSSEGGYVSGSAYIFFGKPDMKSSISAANADVQMVGENDSAYLGKGVSSAGDVNNDGFDDVFVGAYLDGDGGNQSGCAYILYGKTVWDSLIDAADADVKIVGETAGSELGYSVSCAGDFNNDGFDDVVVGARWDSEVGNDAGAAYIFYGSANLSTTIYAASADVILKATDAGDNFGHCVSSAGDVNGDGFDDVVIGAWSADYGGNDLGGAFIFFGSANCSSRKSAGDADVKIIGKDPSDLFGWGVSGAGDVDNNGVDDVIVGARYDDDGGNESGCAYIFFFNSSLTTDINASNANVHIAGEDAEDWFGCSVGGGK